MTHSGQVLGPDARGGVAWRISSYSNSTGGSCVEAGALPDATGRVAVRHSHHPHGLALVVGQPTWTAFIDGVKNDALTPLRLAEHPRHIKAVVYFAHAARSPPPRPSQPPEGLGTRSYRESTAQMPQR